MLRFHSPLIEPDVRISRIRLSDKITTLTPTAGGVPSHPASLAQAVRAGSRWGSVHTPHTLPCACDTATDAACDACEPSPCRRRGLQAPDRSSWPSHATCG